MPNLLESTPWDFQQVTLPYVLSCLHALDTSPLIRQSALSLIRHTCVVGTLARTSRAWATNTELYFGSLRSRRF